MVSGGHSPFPLVIWDETEYDNLMDVEWKIEQHLPSYILRLRI